jgi:Cu(I)/Ag(I) efflux system membrane fusion protein
MRLEPITPGADSGSSGSEIPGTVHIPTDKQQLIGVRTEEVRQTSASHVLRVPGRITVDDQRLYRIVAAADGWILDLGPNAAGRFVGKDQVLASYYTRDLLGSEQLYLTSLGAVNAPNQRGVSNPSLRMGASLVPQYPIDTLRGIGMHDLQIEEVNRTRTASADIKIYSPVAGYVLERNISPGQRFEKGTEFYRIADISHVWVMTDFFEKDRQFMKPGALATVRYQGRRLMACMSHALPQFDPASRVLKTRFELDNPGQVLLPDMFVDVELPVDKPEAITVPADAVIDSGRHKTVYVEKGKGVFEPRMVEIGWRLGDRVQIARGLEPGERIVVAGNFLIDSESRMKMPDSASAANTDKAKTVKDLVCGMDIDPKSANTTKTVYKCETYYFCCDSCKKSFEANPEKYVAQEAPAPLAEATTAKDLVCGMNVDPKSPNTFKTQYKGKTYYFCAEMCKKSFDADPEKYVHKMAEKDMHGTHMSE